MDPWTIIETAASLVNTALRMYTEYRRDADRYGSCNAGVNYPWDNNIIGVCFIKRDANGIKMECEITHNLTPTTQYYCRQTLSGFCAVRNGLSHYGL